MPNTEKDVQIITEFTEAKKLLHAMFGKKIRYILLTDHATDFTTPVKSEPGRFDIHLTTVRVFGNQKLPILGGALHEAAHVIFSREFAEKMEVEVFSQKINLLEDIFVNHHMSLKYRGAADLINATYDMEDPYSPADTWEAVFALNKTLLTKQGINWEYVERFISQYKDDIEHWFNQCSETGTYKERVPVHKQLIEKINENGDVQLANDVFGAISALLGGGIAHQCSVSISEKDLGSNSDKTNSLNSQLKAEQEKVEKQEEAKASGFTAVDDIDILIGEPDIRPVNKELVIKFRETSHKKALEKSAFDHRMLSGSLSKKKIHNFGLVSHGLIRPMFKRRELGDIAKFFILLDGSGSMCGYESKVKEITSSLVSALNERYEVYGGIFRDDRLHVAKGGLPKVDFGGGTPALAAVNAAIENMKRRQGSKYIIFISDMEFEYPEPVVPNSIKLIKVITDHRITWHSWEPHCSIDELPMKIGRLIANAR